MFKRVCQRLAVVAVLLLPTLAAERGWAQHPTEAGEPSLTATPNLIREIQFMLSTVGIDPGPLDGNSRQLTNRAIISFNSAVAFRLRTSSRRTDTGRGCRPAAQEAAQALQAATRRLLPRISCIAALVRAPVTPAPAVQRAAPAAPHPTGLPLAHTAPKISASGEAVHPKPFSMKASTA
jgi:hypothetical protein